MSHRYKLLLSFVIYGLGLSSILLADIYVSATLSADEIASWASVKSAVFILGNFLMLGFDQVIVRHKERLKVFYKKLFVQVIILSFLVVGIYVYTSTLDDYIFLLLSVISFSIIQIHYAIYRAERYLILSQLTTNSWKIVLLITIVISSSPVLSFAISLTLLSVYILVNFLRCDYPNYKPNVESDGEIKEYRLEGFAFALHNLTMVLAVYGEQFILAFYDLKDLASILFSHFAIVTPIALSINGFLGFYLAPKMKADVNFDREKLTLYVKKVTFFSLLITFASVSLAYVTFDFIYPSRVKQDELFFLFGLVCVIRGIYVCSSSALGVYADKKTLYKTALINGFVTLLYILMIIASISILSTNDILIGIISCSILNWLSRLLVSSYFAYKALR